MRDRATELRDRATELRDDLENLKPEEAALLVLLKSRLNRELESREQGEKAGTGGGVKGNGNRKRAPRAAVRTNTPGRPSAKKASRLAARA